MLRLHRSGIDGQIDVTDTDIRLDKTLRRHSKAGSPPILLRTPLGVEGTAYPAVQTGSSLKRRRIQTDRAAGELARRLFPVLFGKKRSKLIARFARQLRGQLDDFYLTTIT
jgi:hypothetical protein